MELEEVLSSRGRVRVLKVLLAAGELNISEVAKRAKLNHTAVAIHVEALKRARLLEEKQFGRVRILKARLEDPRVQALKKAFEIFELYGGERRAS